MRGADALRTRTDIPDNVYEGLRRNQARELHLFVRRGVTQAKFSVQELREMEQLPGVRIAVDDEDFDLDEETIEAAGGNKLVRQMVEELFAIREMAQDMEDDGNVDYAGNPADRVYHLHFNALPVEITGTDGAVSSLRVERTRTGADGVMERTGEFVEYPVQAVYHAIGYKPAAAEGIAYDEHRTVLANDEGRILAASDSAQIVPRLYATGWAKRGPVGLIGSTKSDALLIVGHMLDDLAAEAGAGALAGDRDAGSIDRLLAERGVRPIDFAGWKRVDRFEREQGSREGREHKKVTELERLRAIAHAE
ncbi:MAG: glutamate synthase, partial [Bifidobacterium mongoliense]|nr:glutamate synthase [Bifidobacterium mongoliense]